MKKRLRSATARGYGFAHQMTRRRLAPLVATGTVICPRCKKPIRPGQNWHLGHRDDGHGYNGPEHAWCNTRAAAYKTNSRHLKVSRTW
jgi:hypothetical protein